MKIHPSLTADVLIEAAESSEFGLESIGFCIACGAEHDGCEPDARKYPCDECGERSVYGASELLFHVIA